MGELFEQNSVIVAKELIGAFLCRKIDNKIYKYKIVETEGYEGLKDLASHASRRMTERNKIMFGASGIWYVYFTYGMHYMLNIVCGKKGHPSAVLIRGVEGILGPARLTKALKIDKKFNGKKSSRESGLWIEKRNLNEKRGAIIRTPRIGVDYAKSIWSQKKYRFVLKEFETKKFNKKI